MTAQTMYKEGWPAEKTYAHRCSERAIDYIRSHKDTDFFLVLSYDEPHDPSLCPEPFAVCTVISVSQKEKTSGYSGEQTSSSAAWSGPRRFQGPGRSPDPDERTFRMQQFCGQRDSAVSQMQPKKSWDRISPSCTQAIMEIMAQSHCLYAKGPSAYEEIAHIPFILWGQGTGVVDTPVSHIDIAATVWDFFALKNL